MLETGAKIYSVWNAKLRNLSVQNGHNFGAL